MSREPDFAAYAEREREDLERRAVLRGLLKDVDKIADELEAVAHRVDGEDPGVLRACAADAIAYGERLREIADALEGA